MLETAFYLFFADELHVGALFANSLLHHLEPSWAQISGDHLLTAVALACSGRMFYYRLVPGYLELKEPT